MIDSTTIAINRYAPQGSQEIRLYSNGLDGGSGLTIGQLAIAVSMRSAAVCEAESVIKMNKMSSGSLKLDKASEYIGHLADDSMVEWGAARAYLIDELGIDAEDLPEAVDSYTKRMLVNRRDVAYSTSSNIVRTIGTSMSKDSANFA